MAKYANYIMFQTGLTNPKDLAVFNIAPVVSKTEWITII